MALRKSYFVSLDKETITEMSIPDTAEYEIIVTQEELEQFKMLLRSNESDDFWFAMRNLVFKPFAEDEVEGMREDMDDNLMRVYQYLYNFGSMETKEKLIATGLVQEITRDFNEDEQ